jgi:cytochrome c oxidase subunit II
MTTRNLRRFAPVLALGLLAAVPLALAASDAPAATDAPAVVEIAAQRFEFTPAEITVERGRPVTLKLTTRDVTHGFFQKALDLDELIVPGKPTLVTITPAQAGRYTVICDHFCGAGHGGMHMTIVVK